EKKPLIMPPLYSVNMGASASGSAQALRIGTTTLKPTVNNWVIHSARSSKTPLNESPVPYNHEPQPHTSPHNRLPLLCIGCLACTLAILTDACRVSYSFALALLPVGLGVL